VNVDRRLLGWGLFFILLGGIPLAVKGGLLDEQMVGQWPLRGPVSATGSVGYYDLSQLFGTGYFYGSAGLAWTFERFRIDLAYFATSHEATALFGPGVAGDRWSLTAAWSF